MDVPDVLLAAAAMANAATIASARKVFFMGFTSFPDVTSRVPDRRVRALLRCRAMRTLRPCPESLNQETGGEDRYVVGERWALSRRI